MNLIIILNFKPNTKKLLKCILKRDTQQKLKMKTTHNVTNYLPHHRVVNKSAELSKDCVRCGSDIQFYTNK